MAKTNSTLTYLDAGVLIAVTRGTAMNAARALSIISDPARAFVASSYLRLEVLPKAVYFKQSSERAFYESFFNAVTVWKEPTTADAYATACRYGMAALDALHLQSALDAGAPEIITTEKPTKPIYRAQQISVINFFTL